MNVRLPRATVVLIGACASIFLATEFLQLHALRRALSIAAQPNALTEIGDGQWWRLFTPILLHFGVFHFVFNMLWTWLFAGLIESRQGASALLLLTAGLAVPANLAQFLFSGPWFGGMSAVVYGYLGYLWMQGKFNPAFGVQLQPQVLLLLLGWFVVCWSGILELFGVHVANVAHTAGLVSGLVLGLLSVGGARLQRRR